VPTNHRTRTLRAVEDTEHTATDEIDLSLDSTLDHIQQQVEGDSARKGTAE